MFKQICALVLLAACVAALDYDDCGSTSDVSNFRVTGCTQQPCVFVKGQHYDIEADVLARSNSTRLPFKVTGIIVIPIVIIEGDACDTLTAGSCPAYQGQNFSALIPYDVPATFPQLDTRVKMEVKDDQGRIVICGEINVQIRNSAAQNLLELLEYLKTSKTARIA